MREPIRFRVWCLSWEEAEAHGRDVVAYDILGELPRGLRGTIFTPHYDLHDAEDAAEAYADYVYSQQDGYECAWPLTFRVRSADGSTADFEVNTEYVVEFHASPAKPAKPAERVAPPDAKEGGA